MGLHFTHIFRDDSFPSVIDTAIKALACILNHVGAFYMVVAGACLALAGVRMELLVKSSKILGLLNVQPVCESCVFAILGMPLRSNFDSKSFFAGYDGLAWT
jgi:hypothetical protein